MKPFLICLFCLLISSTTVFAEASDVATPPQPPQQNPHPPQTAKDRERVAFAELAIKNLLTQNRSAVKLDPHWNLNNTSVSLQLPQTCLQNLECLQKEDRLQRYIDSIYKTQSGPLVRTSHTHIVPWALKRFEFYHNPSKGTHKILEYPLSSTKLKKNEYMMHTYVEFQVGSWHHLDVIVSENKEGEIFFERFYIIPFPKMDNDIAPGDVCSIKTFFERICA